MDHPAADHHENRIAGDIDQQAVERNGALYPCFADLSDLKLTDPERSVGIQSEPSAYSDVLFRWEQDRQRVQVDGSGQFHPHGRIAHRVPHRAAAVQPDARSGDVQFAEYCAGRVRPLRIVAQRSVDPEPVDPRLRVFVGEVSVVGRDVEVDPWQASVAEPVAAVDPGMQVEGEVGVECPEHRHQLRRNEGDRPFERQRPDRALQFGNDAVPGDRHAAVESYRDVSQLQVQFIERDRFGMFRIERETAFQGDRQAAAGVQRIEPDAVHGAQVDFVVVAERVFKPQVLQVDRSVQLVGLAVVHDSSAVANVQAGDVQV